jgi:hypothetical protein
MRALKEFILMYNVWSRKGFLYDSPPWLFSSFFSSSLIYSGNNIGQNGVLLVAVVLCLLYTLARICWSRGAVGMWTGYWDIVDLIHLWMASVRSQAIMQRTQLRALATIADERLVLGREDITRVPMEWIVECLLRYV